MDLDTNVMSFQGGGHVILGSFAKRCPGIPSLCGDSFTVSFWMKHGGKRFTSQNHDVIKALIPCLQGVLSFSPFLC